MRNSLFLAIVSVAFILGCSSGNDLSPKQFESYILTAKNVRLIDVRSPEEFAKGHIRGAENIPISDTVAFVEAIDSTHKSVPYAVYCQSGKRSLRAANIISSKAKAVYNLKGGVTQWEKASLPIVKSE